MLKIYNYILSKLSSPIKIDLVDKVIFILLGFAGFWIIALQTGHFGPGLTPDSVFYIGTARNIADGNGITTFDGIPNILWPPLYPLLLSLPDIVFGVDPLASAHYINAILFGLIVILSCVLFSRSIFSSILFAITGGIIILLSNIMHDLVTIAWSETLFILLVLIFLIYLERFLASYKIKFLLIFSISAALACLTRYIGICLIISGILTLLLFDSQNVKKRFRAILVFTVISSLPLGAWAIRNYLVSGSFLGHHDASSYTFIQNIEFTYRLIRDWGYFPPKDKLHNYYLVIIGFLLIVTIIVQAFFDKKMSSRVQLLRVRPIIVYVFVYVSFLIYTSTTSHYDQIDFRLLSPVYIPITLLFLFFIDVLTEPVRNSIKPVMFNLLLVAAMSLWIYTVPYKRTKIMTNDRLIYGPGGYGSAEWHNSDLIKKLKSSPLEPDHQVYSNDRLILYVLSNIKSQASAINLPLNTKSDSVKSEKNSSGRKYSDFDYLIWFDKVDPDSYSCKKEQVESNLSIKKIIEASDGALYIVDRTGTSK